MNVTGCYWTADQCGVRMDLDIKESVFFSPLVSHVLYSEVAWHICRDYLFNNKIKQIKVSLLCLNASGCHMIFYGLMTKSASIPDIMLQPGWTAFCRCVTTLNVFHNSL